MDGKGKLVGVVFVLVMLGCHVAARRDVVKVDHDERRGFLLVSFGFLRGGHMHVMVEDFKLHPLLEDVQPDYSRAGLSIQRRPRLPVLEEPQCDPLMELRTFPDAVSQQSSDFEESFSEEDEGNYGIYFINCCEGTTASFTAHIENYNAGPDYLSAGESMLPTVYMAAFVAYGVALLVWVVYLVRHREFAHTIHYLMSAVVLVKTASLLFESLRYAGIQETGSGGIWSPSFYAFAITKNLMLFTVLLLLGTGWFFLKPSLAHQEKKIVVVVLVLQLFANIAMVETDERAPGSYTWLTWYDLLRLFDIICCCALLFPIVWTIRSIREAARTDGRASRDLERLEKFQHFYVIVISYIYFTRIVIFLINETMPFTLTYVSHILNEIVTLAFYVWVGHKFRPTSDNPYLSIPQQMTDMPMEIVDTAEDENENENENENGDEGAFEV